MTQTILKKITPIMKEQENEFIIFTPVELQIPEPEALRPQAKPKKGLSRLFKKNKYNVKYLTEVADMKRMNLRLNARVVYGPRHINF